MRITNLHQWYVRNRKLATLKEEFWLKLSAYKKLIKENQSIAAVIKCNKSITKDLNTMREVLGFAIPGAKKATGSIHATSLKLHDRYQTNIDKIIDLRVELSALNKKMYNIRNNKNV